jgi:predicted ATPase
MLLLTIQNFITHVYLVASKVDEHMLDHRQQQVVSWLSAPDPSTNFNKAKKQRHAGTGTWFLKINSYKQWQENPCASLWLHGLAGCGKTVLSSTIIRDLQDKSSENIVSTVNERGTKRTLCHLLQCCLLRLIPPLRYHHSPLENTSQREYGHFCYEWLTVCP